MCKRTHTHTHTHTWIALVCIAQFGFAKWFALHQPPPPLCGVISAVKVYFTTLTPSYTSHSCARLHLVGLFAQFHSPLLSCTPLVFESNPKGNACGHPHTYALPRCHGILDYMCGTPPTLFVFCLHACASPFQCSTSMMPAPLATKLFLTSSRPTAPMVSCVRYTGPTVCAMHSFSTDAFRLGPAISPTHTHTHTYLRDREVCEWHPLYPIMTCRHRYLPVLCRVTTSTCIPAHVCGLLSLCINTIQRGGLVAITCILPLLVYPRASQHMGQMWCNFDQGSRQWIG